MQLRRSIAIPFIGMLILLVIGTLTISYRVSSQSLLNGLERKEHERLFSIHLNIEETINDQAEEAVDLAAFIAKTHKIQVMLSSHRQHLGQQTPFALEGVDDLTRSLVPNSYVQIINQSGKLLHSTDTNEVATYSDRLWGLAEALAGQPSLVAEKTANGWSLRAFSPIYTPESVLGVVIVGTRLNNSFANEIAMATNTKIVLLTWQGPVASNIEGALPSSIDISSAWRSTVMEGENPIFKHDRIQKKAFLYSPLKLGDESFCLVIQSDSSDLFSLLSDEKKHLIVNFGWLFLVVIGLGGLTFPLILRPLIRLRHRAIRLANKYGQPGHKEITSGNEVTSLIRTFNLMEDAITHHSEELTKSEQLREQLEKENRQAQKMRAMGTLAGGIAHDFNNILTAILGFTELAHRSLPPDSAEKKHLEKVLLAGRKARNLIKQILLFGRKSDGNKKSIDLSRAIHETVTLIKASLTANISIKEDLDTDAGNVLADPTEISQLLMNLCTNAHQAMNPGGGTLKISLRSVKVEPSDLDQAATLTAGEYIKLTISDTGCGMEQQTRERIFEPYFTTRSQEEGSGLGLAIVHSIVASCNGYMDVESQVDVGSSFHLWFPRHFSASEIRYQRKSQRTTGDEQILFVDDEEPIRLYVATTLSALGYKVSLAADVPSALEMLATSSKKYQLVVSDQTMPDGTGTDLALQIQQHYPDIPIILCSGNTQAIDTSRAQVRGVRSIIAKPFDVQKMARAIRKVFDSAPGEHPKSDSNATAKPPPPVAISR